MAPWTSLYEWHTLCLVSYVLNVKGALQLYVKYGAQNVMVIVCMGVTIKLWNVSLNFSCQHVMNQEYASHFL